MTALGPLVRPDWPAATHVRAFVTTREMGDMANGAAGQTQVRSLLPEEPVWMKQVHGIAVADADAAKRDHGVPQADAAVAMLPGTVCTVRIADCMPVFLAEESGAAVAVAHAGWRGLCGGVLEATVARLGVPPPKLLAWLGPAIGPRVYEVGDEVRAAFIARDPRAEQAFAPNRPGHWLLDLYAVARQRLEQAGVTRVSGGGFCTYTDRARFYSFRRDGSLGRMAALIWLA